ncbi:hypothetical protein D9M68_813800 [compost metagenome]
MYTVFAEPPVYGIVAAASVYNSVVGYQTYGVYGFGVGGVIDSVAIALLHTTGGADLVAAGPAFTVATTGTRGDSQPTFNIQL